MKLRSLFAAFLLITFIFSGCDKKENETQPITQPAPAPGMTATLDGKPWKAVNPKATTKNQFIVAGASPDEISINLFHGGITEPGTYHVTAMIMEPVPSTASAIAWGHPNAEITVTKYDMVEKKVSGTFSFIASPNPGATGTRVVTDGIFTDIPVQ